MFDYALVVAAVFAASVVLTQSVVAAADDTPQPFEQQKAPEVAGGTLKGMRGYPKIPADLSGSFFPFIDTLGQYAHRDWPGKTKSVEELKASVAAEDAELSANPGVASWDKYGGWASGPSLEATGQFRTQKIDGKWWLVDPDGRLFFSHGVNCVRMAHETPVEDRPNWFADFPGDKREFAEFFSTQRAIHGDYSGRTVRSFDFSRANLLRKYGADWRARSADVAHRRLRAWGLNTIGMWSDRDGAALRRTPYTATAHVWAPPIQAAQGYWGQFPDVFDPRFAESAKKEIARHKDAAQDPMCLGFFLDNELSWGNDGVSLAMASLLSPADQRAKQVLVEDMKAKYATVDALNAAWGTKYESWDAMLASTEAPADKAKPEADLKAFYRKITDTYFRTMSEAMREGAPGKLYLGCRFAWTNPTAIESAGKYCDVVSFNIYKPSLDGFKLPEGVDKPVLIGEYHFGALDRGMFHTGLVPVKDQAARAEAYKRYVTSALNHPNLVGTHWFLYQDQPTTGRTLDGENYQIGLVDVADHPYAETIAAVREMGQSMYEMRSGK